MAGVNQRARAAVQFGRVRTILKIGGPEEVEKARIERERFVAKLRRRRRRAAAAAYHRKYRADNAARIAAQKKRWVEENRDHVNAYMRRYDGLTPGRREYKAKWLRDRRALDRSGAREVAE